ncbi:MAG: protein-glutamate O-methyltransferase CheR [Thermoplasmata archaeon]
MENTDLEELLQTIRNDRGLDLSGYKESFLMRRLNSRLRVLGIHDIKNYASFLRNNPAEYAKLIDVLSINVTEFFRDVSMYRQFSQKILPDLIESRLRTKAKILRFLSAGGATGEEAYSIAILCREALREHADDITASVMLIDIDPDALRKARAAVYSLDRLKNVPSDILSRYFVREEDGKKYRVINEIRNMVSMSRLDLLTCRLPKFFDVIFCRNVLIYFSRDAHSDLFMRLYNSLVMDGYLILGRTETLLGANKNLFETVDARERIYRKRQINVI